ncbi:MAG: DNA mismatch repair endonuclease MutL, partial [Verrucomicrobiota bacterium]
MGNIRLMPDALASQVAAGEVVERPASVVKELVENSLDAGANTIEVRVQRGGMSLIEVVDDGLGMSREDALMCLERHATSKIHSSEDLDGISTLGFRGEALPSIASVSKFRLATRERDALSGTEIFVQGGKLTHVRDSGAAPGTRVEVRSLFSNIPARRKFLRTENTEFSHVEQQVRVQAIAHPEVGFRLIRDDRSLWQLPAGSGLLERIQGLAGGGVASQLLEVTPWEDEGLRIHGYIGGFGMGRSNRSLQLTFLNGRPVEAAIINYGLKEGFHTALMKGQHPVVFLFLEMSPFAVDVNVHPAKKEIRFRDGNRVKRAISEVVRDTLHRDQMTVPGQRVRSLEEDAPSSPRVGAESSDPSAEGTAPAQPSLTPSEGASPAHPRHTQPALIPQREQVALRNDWSELSGESPSPASLSDEEVAPNQKTALLEGTAAPDRPAISPEDFRILGVLGKLYVLMESKDGLVLMDQHAAHERILFEEMRRRMDAEGVPTQRLLTAITVEVSPRDFEFLSQNFEAIQRLGVGMEPFGA